MPDRSTFLKQKRRDGKRTFQYAKYPEIPLSVNDIYVTTTTGDRLDLLANDYYGDHKLWWIISKANPNKVKRDTLFLEPGMQIRIPENFQKIYSDFKKINK